MVNTYGQDIDQMVENWQAQLWEELNQEDHRYDNWFPAISKIREAVSLLYQATSKLQTAAEWTAGTEAEDRIASLAMELDKISSAVYTQAATMEREY